MSDAPRTRSQHAAVNTDTSTPVSPRDNLQQTHEADTAASSPESHSATSLSHLHLTSPPPEERVLRREEFKALDTATDQIHYSKIKRIVNKRMNDIEIKFILRQWTKRCAETQVERINHKTMKALFLWKMKPTGHVTSDDLAERLHTLRRTVNTASTWNEAITNITEEFARNANSLTPIEVACIYFKVTLEPMQQTRYNPSKVANDRTLLLEISGIQQTEFSDMVLALAMQPRAADYILNRQESVNPYTQHELSKWKTLLETMPQHSATGKAIKAQSKELSKYNPQGPRIKVKRDLSSVVCKYGSKCYDLKIGKCPRIHEKKKRVYPAGQRQVMPSGEDASPKEEQEEKEEQEQKEEQEEKEEQEQKEEQEEKEEQEQKEEQEEKEVQEQSEDANETRKVKKEHSKPTLEKTSPEEEDVTHPESNYAKEPDNSQRLRARISTVQARTYKQTLEDISPEEDIMQSASRYANEPDDPQWLQAVEIALKENQRIKPSAASTIPFSELTLETHDEEPVIGRQFPLSSADREFMRLEIRNMLKTKVISRTYGTSDYQCPLLVVRSGKKPRLVFDYRLLNTKLKEGRAFEPPPEETIREKVKSARKCWQIDLTGAYHQFRIRPMDAKKTAFEVDGVQYKFLRMPFGLKNNTGHFQFALCRWLDDDNLAVFVDDITGFCTNDEEGIGNAIKTIRRLTEGNLRINTSKCHWGVRRAHILGFDYTMGAGKQVDPTRILETANLPRPASKKQLQNYLGTINYISQHVPEFARIAAPLTDLLKGKREPKKRRSGQLQWTSAHDTAYNRIKQAIVRAVTLHVPDPKLPLILMTDASDTGGGALLVQREDNGKTKLIASFARKWNNAQQQYPTTTQEVYTIMLALRKMTYWTVGRHIIVECDHQAAAALNDRTTPLVARWANIIRSNFDITVKFVPGISNTGADLLSRLWEGKKNEEAARGMSEDKLTQAQRVALLREAHSDHAGADKMVTRIQEIRTWPGITNACKQYVQRCTACLTHSPAPRQYAAPRHISADTVDEMWQVDVATFVHPHGKALAIIDAFSRYAWMIPIDRENTATVVLAMKELFTRLATKPRRIVTDNGPCFGHEFVTAMAKCDIAVPARSAHNPQANGMIERLIRTIKMRINKKKDVNQWKHQLTGVMQAYNADIHASTGTKPIEVYQKKTSTFWITKLAQAMQKANELSNAEHEDILSRTNDGIMKSNAANKKKMEARPAGAPIRNGDLVMLRDGMGSRRTKALYQGPFKATAISDRKVKLTDTTGQTLRHTYPRHMLRTIRHKKLHQGDGEIYETKFEKGENEEIGEVSHILSHGRDEEHNMIYETQFKDGTVHWIRPQDFESDMVNQYHRMLKTKNQKRRKQTKPRSSFESSRKIMPIEQQQEQKISTNDLILPNMSRDRAKRFPHLLDWVENPTPLRVHAITPRGKVAVLLPDKPSKTYIALDDVRQAGKDANSRPQQQSCTNRKATPRVAIEPPLSRSVHAQEHGAGGAV